jgi:type VI secretion system protein ImpH
MPGTQRRNPAGLIDRLIEQPYRFNFFQAVRLLDLWLRRGRTEHGKSLDSILRFKNSVSLNFPPSQIEAISVHADAVDSGTPAPHQLRQLRLTPAFMGFLGVNGVLPYDYTATIAAQIALNKNEAGRAFFDSFSHRSMLLFYRAWAKSRIECRDIAGHDSFIDLQLALAGRQERGADAAVLPDEVIARYAALIRHRPVQADLVAGVLAEYFAMPVRCQALVGAWARLDRENRTELGAQNHVLGRGLMLGKRYWRRGAIVRLWLGPLKRADFDCFLPGGTAVKALKAMLALFALPTVAFEVRPILRATDVRPARLDGLTRIGHGAVLLTAPRSADHESAGYHITS